MGEGSALKLIHLGVDRRQALDGWWWTILVPCYVGLSIGLLATRQLALPTVRALRESKRDLGARSQSFFVN